ncbi:MAG: hypothetical protein E7166_03550 [Firmicutes bacterium]|nr:hypothetical protein [Bacillota bacterium]
MKLEYFNLNNIVVYLNNNYLESIKFDITNNIEQQFKKLFINIKNIYNIDMNGYYEVVVHINDIYGMIIEIDKDDDEYVKLFGDTVDMKITFKFDSPIYYKLDEYKKFNIDNYSIYYYDETYYLKLDNNLELNYSEYLKLIENSVIVYGDELKRIKNQLIKVN